MEEVLRNHVLHEGTEDGRGYVDLSATLESVLGKGVVDCEDTFVGGGTAGDGDRDDTGSGTGDRDEAVDPLQDRVGGGGLVAEPDHLLDLAVDAVDDAFHQVLLEGQFMLGGVQADQVFCVLAEEVLRADFHLDLDGGSLDQTLGDGGGAGSGEAAVAAVREGRVDVEDVQVLFILDTSLDGDTLAGAATEDHVLDEHVLGLLDVSGQAAHDEISVSHC